MVPDYYLKVFMLVTVSVIAVASITSVFTYATSNDIILNLAIAATVFYIAGSYIGATWAIKNG